jgi:hypothetical protein
LCERIDDIPLLASHLVTKYGTKLGKRIELHLLDTGHFALEEDGDVIAGHIRRFLTTHLAARQ